LQKIGCPSQKIRIARLGVGVDKIPFQKRPKKSGELHLLQIASFKEKKGHEYTIDAFLRVLPQCPNMTLTFVGDDNQGIKERIKQKVIASPAGDKVTFMDGIEYDHIYELMQKYQVFIHPSCFTEEKDCEGGAPIVLLDAQATGMPIISTIHCDIPEEVVQNKTGLLSPEKDTLALSESIRSFYYMDQQEYDTFASNCRQHVSKEYDVVVNARRMREIYEEVLGTDGNQISKKRFKDLNFRVIH
jgi:colanic acid/amylovoran biosynthesis glycosyltransferase